MYPVPSTENLKVERHGAVFTITLRKPPQNRLTRQLCQELIGAYRFVEEQLSNGKTEPEGAVILQGNDDKYFCTVCQVMRIPKKLNVWIEPNELFSS